MKAKTAPAMTVMVKELRTTMKTLTNDVGDLPQQVFREAIQNKMHPSGPQYWMYEWFDKHPNEDSEFRLSICLPITTFGQKNESESFVVKHLSEFKHLSAIHLGAWDKLNETYSKLMESAQMQNLKPGSRSREIYINCDFENPVNNITEVQFELI